MQCVMRPLRTTGLTYELFGVIHYGGKTNSEVAGMFWESVFVLCSETKQAMTILFIQELCNFECFVFQE